ncbi:MAG: DUF3794 domain-containing protein [Firmicutes bacterium]|nr:DUF3794 domain-containing protein [Bacillota bacterium]
MSLSVKENRFTAVNRLGENTLQTVLQGTVELAGTAAPVERVVWIKGAPVLESATADQDRVYVRGVVDLAMVYVPETLEGDPAGLKRVEWPGALPFDLYVEVIGAEPEMIAEVETDILVCEWEPKAGQYALDLDLILAVTARVAKTEDFNVISQANIGRSVKLLTDGIFLNPETLGIELEQEKDISSILDLPEDAPPIQTVLDLACKAEQTGKKLLEGQVFLEGAASFDLIYEARDFTIHQLSWEQELPFELSFNHQEIEPGQALQKKIFAKCQGFSVNEGKALRVELHLTGQVSLQKREELWVLTEITTPAQEVETRKELIGVDTYVNRKEQQGTAQGVIEIGPQFPPIRELLRCEPKANLSDYQIDDDKIVLEGHFDLELFYLAHSEEDVKPLYRAIFPQAASFQQTLVLSGLEPGMQPKIALQVLKAEPDLINRETVEVNLTFLAKVAATEYREVEVVVEAAEVEPAPEDPPTLTYVFAQEGDTVWKLSRQYHTTEEEILRANPLLQDSPPLLKPGDKICIFRN